MSYNRRPMHDVTPPVDWEDILRRPPPDLRRPIFIIVGLALLWIFFSVSPRLYTDFRWFEELGYASVFTTEINARLAIFFAATFAFFLFYLINIFIARRLTPRISDESSRWAQFTAFAGKSVTF